MGLETPKSTDQGQRSAARHFKLTERLYKTQDGRIVPQDDPEANSLWKAVGQSIPIQQAIDLGLTEKEESVEKPSGDKKAAKPKDKKAPAPKNKGKGGN